VHAKYRSHLDIIASILEATRINALGLHTLMNQSNTSFALFKRYLESIIEIGLMEKETDQDRILYKATEKGLVFLERYHSLQQMLVDAKLNESLGAAQKVPMYVGA
jgi:predicted transcriptional regulator